MSGIIWLRLHCDRIEESVSVGRGFEKWRDFIWMRTLMFQIEAVFQIKK